MYSSTSYPSSNSGAHQGHDGPAFPYSRSQPFTVAGMQNQGVMHSPSLRSSTLAGGSGLNVGGTLGDSLAQSRSHYQPGYLMVSRSFVLGTRPDRANKRVIMSSPRVRIP